ncbi:hypothetical protein RCL1_000777 [Eukaryota sp. TZLM3-RCL]
MLVDHDHHSPRVTFSRDFGSLSFIDSEERMLSFFPTLPSICNLPSLGVQDLDQTRTLVGLMQLFKRFLSLSNSSFTLHNVNNDHTFLANFPRYSRRHYIDHSLYLRYSSSHIVFPVLCYEEKGDMSSNVTNSEKGFGQLASVLINALHSFILLYNFPDDFPLFGILGDDNYFYFIKVTLDETNPLVEVSLPFSFNNRCAKLSNYFTVFFQSTQDLCNRLINSYTNCLLNRRPMSFGDLFLTDAGKRLVFGFLGKTSKINEFAHCFLVQVSDRSIVFKKDDHFYRLVTDAHVGNRLKHLPADLVGHQDREVRKLYRMPNLGRNLVLSNDCIVQSSSESFSFVNVVFLCLDVLQKLHHTKKLVHFDARLPNFVFKADPNNPSNLQCSLLDYEFAYFFEGTPREANRNGRYLLPNLFQIPPDLRTGIKSSSHSVVVACVHDFYFFIASLFSSFSKKLRVSIDYSHLEANYQVFSLLLNEFVKRGLDDGTRQTLDLLISPYQHYVPGERDANMILYDKFMTVIDDFSRLHTACDFGFVFSKDLPCVDGLDGFKLYP